MKNRVNHKKEPGNLLATISAYASKPGSFLPSKELLMFFPLTSPHFRKEGPPSEGTDLRRQPHRGAPLRVNTQFEFINPRDSRFARARSVAITTAGTPGTRLMAQKRPTYDVVSLHIPTVITVISRARKLERGIIKPARWSGELPLASR